MESNCPSIVQEGGDAVAAPGYIKDIREGTTVGFKYFDLKDVTGLKIKTRGYSNGKFEIRTSFDGNVLGTIKTEYKNIWTEGECRFDKTNGTLPLYLTFTGQGNVSLKSFEFLH